MYRIKITGRTFIKLLLVIFIIGGLNRESRAQMFEAQVLKLQKQLNNAKGKERCEVLFKLTEAYIERDARTAEQYASQALKEAKKIKSRSYEADALNQLGTIFFRNGAYDEAIDYYEEELDLRKKQQDFFDLAVVNYNVGSAYGYTGNDRKAINAHEESLKYAQKVGHQNLILMNNEALFQVYVSQNRYKKALEYFKEYIRIKDSTFTRKKTKQIAILKTEHKEIKKRLTESDSSLQVTDSALTEVKKEKDTLEKISYEQSLEIDNLKLEAQVRKQALENERLEKRNYQIISGAVVLATILMIILAFVLYRRYRYKRKMNKFLEKVNAELKQQKEEIEAQRDQIEDKNEELQQQNEEIASQRDEIEAQRDLANAQKAEIVAGINYALRIQQAVLPDENTVKKLLPKHFILYKPRDIVSGDFYWVSETPNKIVFAAADCTGHGVPGAFMSMLGMTLLNEVVNQKNITQANLILEELRSYLKSALKQTGKKEEAKDGLDIALCVLEKNGRKLQFAGAYNPLILIRDNEITTVKATRNPVGVYMMEKSFENHEIDLQKGDALYIFSDGFQDQFGREKPDDKIRKFKSKPFIQLLLEIHNKKPETQKDILDRTFENWKKGAHEQVDDVIVMGVFV